MSQKKKIIEDHYSILQTLHRHNKQYLLLSVHTKVTVNYVTVSHVIKKKKNHEVKRKKEKQKKYSIEMKNRYTN